MVNDSLSQLRRDEGEILHAYPDHLGFLTIGVGRLIDKRKGGGISLVESSYLLDNDISRVSTALNVRLPWANSLDPIRKAVLVNMAFQMGIDGLLGFRNTLEMVRTGKYEDAAQGMLNSKWATQTPERALRLSNQMRYAKWY